jgi:hypothetical protein
LRLEDSKYILINARKIPIGGEGRMLYGKSSMDAGPG